MKKRFSLFIVLLAMFFVPSFVNSVQSQNADTLSEKAFASLITCGSGNEYYLAFGHTSIRVCDPLQNLDYVYNYGTFDFDTPNLYWKFIKGELIYCVARSSYDNFVYSYWYEGRSLSEQRLILSHAELEKLFHNLQENNRPENKYYLYDFFRDNCATRARDMIDTSLIDRTLFVEKTCDTNLTFREMIYQYSAEKLMWWQLGVDILLGMRCDRPLTNLQYMFIPFDLANQLDTTCVAGTNQTIAAPKIQILAETKTPNADSIPPALVFWLLFAVVLVLSVLAYRKNWNLKWLDIPLFTIISLLSIIVIVMWFGTIHWCTKENLSVLWANPIFIYFLVRLRKSHKVLIIIGLVFLLVSLLGFGILPQQFNIALLPVILTLITRLTCYLLQKKS